MAKSVVSLESLSSPNLPSSSSPLSSPSSPSPYSRREGARRGGGEEDEDWEDEEDEEPLEPEWALRLRAQERQRALRLMTAHLHSKGAKAAWEEQSRCMRDYLQQVGY
jgi:hypothetical protein